MKEELSVYLRSGGGSENPQETVVQLARKGGGIARYVTHSKDRSYQWLVPANEDQPASFPLVPFCSRIQHGHFVFDGRDIQLPPNNLPERHAIHGHGFQRPWTVVEANDSHAVIEYQHTPDHWPWSYSVRQKFTLSGRNLAVEMVVSNDSDQDMPLGLGLHPYFPKTQLTVVSANVSNLCQLDEALMPVGRRPLPIDLNLNNGLLLGTRTLDHVFTGWDGKVEISWPEIDAKLCMRAHHRPRNLVLWAPAHEDFVCVEPISNLPNGFNLAIESDRGYSILAPGTSLAERWSFEPKINSP